MQVDQYMHIILVEEDANNFNESNGELFHTASEVGEKLYRRGDFAESRIANFDGYLHKEVKFCKWVCKRIYLLHGDSLLFSQVRLFPDTWRAILSKGIM